jgi:hypothetical protein
VDASGRVVAYMPGTRAVKRRWPGRLEQSGDALAVIDTIELGLRAAVIEEGARSRDQLVRMLAECARAETMLSPAYMRSILRLLPLADRFAEGIGLVMGES